jgi:hypothetical protein
MTKLLKRDELTTYANLAQVRSIDDYLTIQQVAEILKCNRTNAIATLEKYNVNKINKNDIAKNGKQTAYYLKDDILNINFQIEQQQLTQIENKATTLNSKVSKEVVANAFKQQLENATPQEILESSMALMQIALNKSNQLLEVKDEAINQLETELGRNKQYLSIKNVAILNNKTDKQYSWRRLKDLSIARKIEIKSEFDSNYGRVNSYHIDIWKEFYPNERYN